MKRINIIILLLCLLTLTSCQVKALSEDEYLEKLKSCLIDDESPAAFIDLRDLESEYALGHIKGFVNFNYQSASDEELITYMEMMYDKNLTIFLIDGNKSDASLVSSILRKNNYKKVIYCNSDYQTIEEKAKEYFYIVTGTDDCGC